jgi:hypothetical protein
MHEQSVRGQSRGIVGKQRAERVQERERDANLSLSCPGSSVFHPPLRSLFAISPVVDYTICATTHKIQAARPSSVVVAKPKADSDSSIGHPCGLTRDLASLPCSLALQLVKKSQKICCAVEQWERMSGRDIVYLPSWPQVSFLSTQVGPSQLNGEWESDEALKRCSLSAGGQSSLLPVVGRFLFERSASSLLRFLD